MIKGTIHYIQANLPNKYGNSLASLTTLLLRKKRRFGKRTSGLKSAPTDLIIHINHYFNVNTRVPLYLFEMFKSPGRTTGIKKSPISFIKAVTSPRTQPRILNHQTDKVTTSMIN
jgi:hypothetical protein